MERLFITHKIRKQYELGGLWDFWTKDDKEDLRKVIVPGCLETYPGYERYRGISYYETTFEGSGNIRLLFKGVSHTGTFLVDDNIIGAHYNAYTESSFVIKNLASGIHKLTIRVDNSYNDESALHIPNDYYTYGGINRPVFVEQIGNAFIRYIHVDTHLTDGSWHAKARIGIESLEGDSDYELIAGIKDEQYVTKCISLIKGINVVEMNLPCRSVVPYIQDDPHLYTVDARLCFKGKEVDDLMDRFGFREIMVKGTDIFCNGTKIKIKGFNRHEDHALYGCAIPVPAMQYDIQLIKDMNCNAVRTSHYPNDERFLDLCDEQGILIWEESHARGLSEDQMRHKNFRIQSNDCIREMINTHYNHPCIFTWGILNECASFSEYGREVYKEQFELIRSLDAYRPVTFASCHFESDICLDLPDIVSMNIYPLWYFDTPAKEHLEAVCSWIQKTGGKGKPVIISEIGAGAIPGFHALGDPKWSEERQSSILKEQLQAVFERKEITGVFIWQYSDCRVGDDAFYGRPRCMNNKGVVDEYRRPKAAFKTVKRIYGTV